MPRTGRPRRARREPRPRGRSPPPSCRSWPSRAGRAPHTATSGTVPIRLSSMPRAILIAIGHLVRRSILPGSCLRSTFVVPDSTPIGPRERVLEVVGRGEDRVDDAVVECLLRLQHPVLLQRVRDHDLEGVLDADEVRQQVRAAPARDDPEEHLGQARSRRPRHPPCGRSSSARSRARRRARARSRTRRTARRGRRACPGRGDRAARSCARCPSTRGARCRRGRRRRRGCTACR